MDLLTVGEAFEDLIFAGLPRLPHPGEELRVPTFTIAAGGGAVITAVAAARLGLRVGTLTALSSGAAASLRRDRVRVANLQREGERGAVSVALSMPHERSFVTFEGVNAKLEPRLLRTIRTRPPSARHVHFALGPQRCRSWLPVVQRFHRGGATTSWDFGWNERLLEDPSFPALMDAVSWLFLNEDEARIYSRTRSASAARDRWMRRRGGTVIKQGARGALVLSDDGVVRRKAMRARAVDTTGAGDAFNAGFLSALVRRASVSDALDLAVYVGARSTEALGGIEGLPRLERLPRRWRRALEAA